MKRIGVLTKIKPGMLEKYTKMHAEIWDDVVRIGHEHNTRNFTIFFDERTGYMFSYFEYIGNDYEADMKEKNSKPIIKEWQAMCRECFAPVDDSADGPLQAPLREIWHNDF